MAALNQEIYIGTDLLQLAAAKEHNGVTFTPTVDSDEVNEVALDKTTTSGYVKWSTGKIGSNSTFSHTDFINIADYESIRYQNYNTTAATPSGGIAFYFDNNENSYISGVSAIGSQSSYSYTDYLTIPVPSGARYVRFTRFTDTSTYGDPTFYGIRLAFGQKKSYFVQGTADSEDAFISIYNNTTALPYGMEAGKTYGVRYSGTNVTLRIYYFLEDIATEIRIYINTSGEKTVTIPSDAVGLLVRLYVAAGVTANERVTPLIFSTPFIFDNDHIKDPVSMKSVDLIEQTLSIDTFNPTILYEGSDYEAVRTIPFGTPVLHYISGVLAGKYYINKIIRKSKQEFKLECVSPIGLLDKSYHVGDVYNGKTFGFLAREVVSRYISTSPPDDGYLEAYDTIIRSDRNIIALDGTPSRNFAVPIDGVAPLVSYTGAVTYSRDGYYLPLVPGHRYQIMLQLISGSVTKSETTYYPGDTIPSNVFSALLMKLNPTGWNAVSRYMICQSTDSSVVTINDSGCCGLVGFIYGGTNEVTFNKAVYSFYLVDHSELKYTMEEEVANTKIFGWLPYDTKRNNLHQVMFSENISITKNADGDMHFEFIKPITDIPTISQNNIFIGGTIDYPATATQVRLSEHSYQDVDTVEPVTLIDNSDEVPVENRLYLFNEAPIVVDSMTTTDDLVIVSKGVNYAIVSGKGTLLGRPYFDKVSSIERHFNSGGEQYTVAVTDATLVTGTNSENVADRLLSYYTTSEKVSADVKVTNEKCGRIYQFIDMFDNTVQAFLTKMTSKVSSFVKTACEFISGYTPNTFGNNYDYWAAVTGTGTITIQEGTKLARFVIVGGGDGGSSGLKGIDDFEDLQAGSVGGAGGTGGNGGKILEVVLRNPTPGDYACVAGAGGLGGAECTSTEAPNLGGTGSASTVTTPDGTVYSSADSGSYLSVNGIKNLFTTDVYACKGRNGCKGGNGGRGSVSGNGESGEDIVWDGVTYRGGQGGKGLRFQFTHVEQAITNGGAGGWGAQPYYNGQDGGSVSVIDYEDNTSSMSGYQAYEQGQFDQAAPASSARPSEVRQTQNYGEGGDGGHGGAGRGGFGSANDYYQASTDPTTNKKILLSMVVPNYNYLVYQSSNGGAGNNGRKGIVLCYADKELFF